jgi:carbon-monoxide dehydrogenase small subunit
MTTTTLTVNGRPREVQAGHRTLLTVLRDDLGLTGTKRGCNQGVCGACTVLIDGVPQRGCLTVAANVAGAEITTIEGLSPAGTLSPIQRALIEAGAVQCGFCTSGMVLAAQDYLNRGGAPDAEAVREALSGNICRCSGYRKIVDAVVAAAGAEVTP